MLDSVGRRRKGSTFREAITAILEQAPPNSDKGVDQRTVDSLCQLFDKNSWKSSFEALEALAPIGIICLDSKASIVRINPAAERIFGMRESDAIDLPVTELIPMSLNERLRPMAHRPSEVTGINSRGEQLPLELTLFPFKEADQHYTMLLIWDSTDLHIAKSKHRSELQRFRTLADLAPMGILQVNKEWCTEYVNDSWLSITGCTEHNIQGINWGKSIYHEDADLTLGKLHQHLLQGKEFHSDCRIQRGVNDVIWVQLHARPLYDSEGEIDGFLATLIDNSYYHQAEEKLRKMAERDALTGLANRVLFFDRLNHALERTDRHGALALLALDLDGFKNVNDTLGHDAGDQLLIEIASRLLTCVRQEDTVSRVGGDEFIILMEDFNDTSAAAKVADKILKELQNPVSIAHQDVFISTSIGICFANTGEPSNARTLLKQADMALYRAKDAGRNNFQYYSPDLEQESRRKLELGNSLHHALARAEFDIFYQAQADVASGDIVGFEALLRWQHPHRGLLPPIEFIPLLEETGLITTVSRWLLHMSMHQLKDWISRNIVTPNAIMSVNISPCQFRDPLLIPSIEGALKDSGLTGPNLGIEITETALLQDQQKTLEGLRKLRAMGVKIALDDFGTGYSSLSYLKKYPIDTIKIDRSFIKDVTVDKEDAAITQAVLALAQSLDMNVIAEGVDTPAILKQLQEWHCDTYQGYLLNQPMAATALVKHLKQYRQRAQ